jgi:hypothetical protein
MTIIKSSQTPCPCPSDGVAIGDGSVTHIDYLDGHPAEHGEYAVEIEDYGVGRGNATEEQELRDLLGIPDPGTDAPVSLLFKMGSGIRVAPASEEYPYWKGYRLDCGCLRYTCDGGSTTADGEVLPCGVDRLVDADGNIDTSPDQIQVLPIMKLNETFPGGDGTIMDGAFDTMFELAETSDSGSFANYVDEYGMVYSASWRKLGEDTLEISTIIKDPRVPGQADAGRVLRTPNGLRVFRTGVITTIFERVRRCNDTSFMVEKTASQEVAEFQATFGCGDEKGDPFSRHLSHSIHDEIEMIVGSETILSDPEGTEFVWEPQVIVGSDGSVSFSLPAPSGYPDA